MKLQEAIDKRHSIREFEKKKVPKSVLKKLVANAAKAPSAANTQPWKFVVVSGKETMEKIRKEYAKFIAIRGFRKTSDRRGSVVYNFYSALGDAQNAFFVYMDKPENEHWRFHKLLSMGGAVENMLLSAVDQGLGACWMASFKDTTIENGLKRILKIKKSDELVSGIVVGYAPKKYKPWIRKKKKLNEIVRFI